MDKVQNNPVPLRPIFKGSILALLILLIITILLTILTELGWDGTIKWGTSLYLTALYLAVMIGAVIAGAQGRQKGWLTGAGVGILTSLWLVALAFLSDSLNFNWLGFFIKILISGFVGCCGGIVGVNYAERRENRFH